jgi:hypothetical protein
MKGTIKRRIQDLETTLARSAETARNTLADAIRARLRGLAKFVGKESAAQAEAFLDEIGPENFTRETIKAILRSYGYERRPNESLAEAMAHAMGLTSSELKDHLHQGGGLYPAASKVPETPEESVDSPRVLPKPVSSGVWDAAPSQEEATQPLAQAGEAGDSRR